MLSKWLIGKDISSSYLYHLLRLSKLYEEYKSGELQGIKFVPLLKYYIDRNFNEKSGFKNRDVVNWNKQLLKVEQSDADWKWSYMKTIVELAHLYRSEKGDG